MVNKFVYGIYVVNSRSYWNSCHAWKEISQLFMTSLSLCCRRFHNCYMGHMTQGAYATMSGFLTGYTWTKARHIPLDLFQQWEALLVYAKILIIFGTVYTIFLWGLCKAYYPPEKVQGPNYFPLYYYYFFLTGSKQNIEMTPTNSWAKNAALCRKQ